MSNNTDTPIAVSEEREPVEKEFFGALYSELHRIAARELRRNSAVTFSPTTLLHETFLNLSPQAAAAFHDQAHFMAYATRAMRGFIIDHIRNRKTQKRGGELDIISLPKELPHASDQDLEIEKLSEAIDELAAAEPRLAQCIDLKFFCGFSFGEIAQMWQVSERTVQRDWDKARLLLHKLMSNEAAPPVIRS